VDLSVSVRWGRESSTQLSPTCEECGREGITGNAKNCPACKAIRQPKVSEKLDVELSDRSGAAEDLGGLALQIAASAWLRERRGARFATVLVDEPFGSLDPRALEGAERAPGGHPPGEELQAGARDRPHPELDGRAPGEDPSHGAARRELEGGGRGMNLKVNVTPLWWRIEAKDPETFATWCTKAVRVLLTVWPHAEVRLSREKLVAVVSFSGDQLVRQVEIDKRKIRRRLAEIIGVTVEPPEEPALPSNPAGSDYDCSYAQRPGEL
jgi:hypothetical protein